ncbi:MAG TPA: hypothetical protein VGR10_00745 [Thermoleophilaceae bacterium]|nr:hypothetical protein [Thermoleophilaceae bacterium]
MGRINAKTVIYGVGFIVLLAFVALLMSRVARTETTSRYLLTIAVVIVGAIVLGGLGAVGLGKLRGGSEGKSEEDESGSSESASSE